MDIQKNQTQESFEKLYVKNAPDWSLERDQDGGYKYHATQSAFLLFEQQQVEIDLLKAELAKAQAVPEGFVLISKDQAKDTERLNFLLSDERYVRTVVQRDIKNEDYEKIGEHFLFTELYWIDGWDYHENTSSQSARGALDKAMIEAQEQKG